MAVLLLAEHDNKTLAPATAKALTAAQAFGGEVDILVVGEGCRAVAESAAKLDGVRKVLLAEGPHLAQRLAEETAAAVLPLMANYGVLLAPATTMGKNVLPRVAAMLDVAADFRHHRGEVAHHFRAPDLCRQRAPDGRDIRQDHGRHGAHHRLCRCGRGRLGRDRGRSRPPPRFRCRASRARRSASASGPS